MMMPFFFFSLTYSGQIRPSSRKFLRDLEREVEGGKERKVRSVEESLYRILRLGAKAHLPPSCFAKALANPPVSGPHQKAVDKL